MKKRRSDVKKGILVLVLTLLSTCISLHSSTVLATPVSLEVLGVNPGTPVTGQFPGFGTITAKAGEYVLSINGGVFDSYCVEMRLAPTQPSTYELVAIPVGSEFHEAAWIMQNYAPVVTGLDNDNLRVDTGLAIWEVISDTGYDLTSGQFNISAGWDITNAQSILTALQSADLGTVNLGAFKIATDDGVDTVDGTQDYLVYAPVPEPATMLLFGSGLIGLAAFGRRFRK
jgi:hypothetical protein